ncbi:MAG TPA: PEP-CTERM sorting domain-containing protein [Opitutaceae bacterium]|nr:PEP-CTERM sorting domain-containing protein [Opitutaceae bacterium]
MALAFSDPGGAFAQSEETAASSPASPITSPALVDFPQGGLTQPYLPASGARLNAGDATLAMAQWSRAVDAMAQSGGSTRSTYSASTASIASTNTWKGSDPSWKEFPTEAVIEIPVPEPSTYGAILLGAACAWVTFRGRRAQKQQRS